MSEDWYQIDCEWSCGYYPVGIDDICGIGVLTGFIGGALIAIMLLAASYILSYNPHEALGAPSTPNPVDTRLLRSLRRFLKDKLPTLIPWFERHHDHLSDALIDGNLNMCDLQILTGLGILVAGFISLPVLKGAHWQMICYLAWFTTVTHISGLTVMSKHLHGRPLERKARVFAMVVLLVILVVAMVPMAGITMTDGNVEVLTWNCDALCFFNSKFLGSHLSSIRQGLTWGDTDLPMQTAAQFASVILGIVLLCFSVVVRIVRLTPNFLSMATEKRNVTSAACQKWLARMSRRQFSSVWKAVLWREALLRPLVCSFLLLRTWLLLWSSMLFEIVWLVFLALYGMSRLIQTSTELYTVEGAIAQGKTDTDDGPTAIMQATIGDYRGGSWSFGQILPVFLLLAPLWGVARALMPEDPAVARRKARAKPSARQSIISPSNHAGSSASVISRGSNPGLPNVSAPSVNSNPRPDLRCLDYLDRRAFGESHLGIHAFVFATVLVLGIMAWFLAVLFGDIGISYSLSTIVSVFPGAVLSGATLASYLNLYLMTVVLDGFPASRRNRFIGLCISQISVDALLALVIGLVSRFVDALNNRFGHNYVDFGPGEIDQEIVRLLSPNLYILFFMICCTISIISFYIVLHLCLLMAKPKNVL